MSGHNDSGNGKNARETFLEAQEVKYASEVGTSSELIYFMGKFGGFTFNEHLRAIRKLQGLSIAEVSRRSGVRESNISRFERGKVGMRWDTISRILNAMDCFPLLVSSVMFESKHKLK